MKCLVTGVAGFIGSHLAERLIKEGHEVIGVDRFSPYYDVAIKECNISKLLESSQFILHRQDVNTLTRDDLKGIEIIFHQAAQAGVRSSWGQDFETYLNDNILATQILLEISKSIGLKRFVHASSSSVYGETTLAKVDEKSATLPFSPYGVTKLAAENLCFLYYKNYSVPAVSLRYFTVYGPRQRPDMAFHKFIFAALKGERIIVYGDGNQRRDFTYVSDVIDANLACIESECIGSVFNIAGGSSVTVRESLRIIAQLTGKELDISFREWQHGDVSRTSADTELAGRKLGYSPKYDLQQGIKDEMDWLLSVRFMK